MRSRIACLVAAVVVAGVTGGLSALPANADSGAPRVVFVRDNDVFIKTVGADDLKVIFQGVARTAAWSPSGDQIAISAGGQIVLYDTVKGTLAHVPGVSDALDVDWLPDGEHLVLTRSTSDRPAVWTIGVDGSDVTMVARPGKCSTSGFHAPSWSSDGAHFLYSSEAPDSPNCARQGRGVIVRSTVDESRQWLKGRVRGWHLAGPVAGHAEFSSDGSSVLMLRLVYRNLAPELLLQHDLGTGRSEALEYYTCMESDSCIDMAVWAVPGGGYAFLADGGADLDNTGQEECLRVVRPTGNLADCGNDRDPDFPWGGRTALDIGPPAQ